MTMKKKSRLLIGIAGLFCAAALSFAVWQSVSAEEGVPMLVDLYPLSPESEYDVAVAGAASYGVQFHASGAFDQMEVYVVSTSLNTTPRLTVSLYRWVENYSSSCSGEPVITQTLEDFSAGWVSFSCQAGGVPLEAGEYVLELRDGKGNVKMAVVMPELENTRLYRNTSAQYGSLKCRLRYVSSQDTLLRNVSENKMLYRSFSDTWTATDGLGRELPDIRQTGVRRENKYVGIFYHTWHASHSASPAGNVTEILREHPEIVHDYNSPLWGGRGNVSWGGNFFWNEPLFGYYNNGSDRWVLRKHAELLADAGVDVLFFDNTNGTENYTEAILTLLEVFAEARADGVKTPQISAMLNMFDYDAAAVQLRELYTEIYAKGLYQDLWFYWEGKPLMLAYPGHLKQSDPLDQKVFDCFTYRPINPSYTEQDAQMLDENGNITIKWSPEEGVRDYICWKWISIYPQAVARRPDGTAEEMCVCIAQNWSAQQGITAMNAGSHVYGRSFSVQRGQDTRENAKLYGANFAEQWEYALQVDPDFIYITGWNEWVAGRYSEMWGTTNAFPDNFDDDHSRDIEPSAGDLKDHYYYQMVSYIRKFKGINMPPAVSDPVTIDLDGSKDQWETVTPAYVSYPGNTLRRDSKGYKDFSYTNETGRNDIVCAKVARDEEFLYFLVETAAELTAASDPGWMRLLLDVEGDSGASWETFHYIVNRTNPGEKAMLERSAGGWNWETVGEVDYRVDGTRLQLKIPKRMLGIESDDFAINFKWSDNMQSEGDILDFYQNGDAAPGGRYKYHYSTLPVTIPGEKEKVRPWLIALLAGGVLAAAGAAVWASASYKRRKKKEESV